MRLARKRKPSAVGYLVRERAPLPEERRGLAGQHVRQGHQARLGLARASRPRRPDRIGGLIEVPALAECLTLNKADFIRSGPPRRDVYLAYRKAIQEAVARQLAPWGDRRAEADRSAAPAARPVERDLERVLVDLAG